MNMKNQSHFTGGACAPLQRVNVMPIETMKTKQNMLLAAMAILAFATSLPFTTRAADSYWKSGGNGNFTSAGNWAGGVAPGAADNAHFAISTNADWYVYFNTMNILNANAFVNSGANDLRVHLAYGYSWLLTNSFVIGQSASQTGSVSFSQTSAPLLVTNAAGTAALVVGQGGVGTFKLAGGTLTVDQLFVTNGANSTLTFSAGTLNTLHGARMANAVVIGSGTGGTATWNILGGTNVASPSTTTYIGDSGGGTGIGRVNVSGTSTVWTNTGQLRVGQSSINNSLTISNGAQVYNASLAYLGTAAGSSNNSVLVTGSNSLWSSGDAIYVGNNGWGSRLTIADGGRVDANTANNRPSKLGVAGTSSNNVVVVTGSNSLWNALGGIFVGESGSGNQLIIQDGGEVRAGDSNTVIGVNAGSVGNSITVSGGTLTVSNASTSLDVRRGALNLNAGTVNVKALYATNGASSVVNLRGGSLWSAMTLIGSGSTLAITDAANQQITGVFTNAGTMSVMNSYVTYQGDVVNLGSYVSDPSTNTFNGNFTVGPTATVAAAAGDIYAFGSNFVMQSTNRAFDMHLAKAVFADTGYGITTGNTNHTIDLTGSGAVDKGSNWLSVADLATNFSIGTLTIGLSNRLTVTGTKVGALTNALYVGTLDLFAWNTNAGLSLTNTLQTALSLPNINLYYDKNLAANAYLQGLSFDLWDGNGLLIPIPEPSALTLTLVASAFSALLLRRKRA